MFRVFLAIVVLFMPSIASAQCRTLNRAVVNQCAQRVEVVKQVEVVQQLAVAQFVGIPVAVPVAFAMVKSAHTQAGQVLIVPAEGASTEATVREGLAFVSAQGTPL